MPPVHGAVMALPPDERRDRAKLNEAVREQGLSWRLHFIAQIEMRGPARKAIP
jgi:hypothetical protein